jgi:integrase
MPTEVRLSVPQSVVEVVKMVRQKDRQKDAKARLKSLAGLGTFAADIEKEKAIIKRRTKWLCDGFGLWLVVSPGLKPDSVRRSWVFRWNVPGQVVVSKSGKARRLQRRIGLGSLNTVTLERARELAERCRRQLEDGNDPLMLKRGRQAQVKIEERKLHTLQKAINEYLLHHGKAWSASHAKGWLRRFQNLKPILDLPVSQIDRPMVIDALRPLWDKHPDQASRVRARLEKVLSAATAWGWREGGENPAAWKGGLEFTFAPKSKLHKEKHHDALSYADAPDFMRQLRAIDSLEARGLELLILAAVRSQEVNTATTEQFDLSETPTWTVPPEATKTGKHTGEPHVIPLSDAAVACLRRVEMKPGERLFPRFHQRTLYRLCKTLHQDITVHGFRAIFSSWAGDNDYPREVTEAALHHQVGNKVEQAYRRTTWLNQRRRLMQGWATYLDGKTADNVVRIKRGRK